MIIYSYNAKSEGAKLLAETLGIKRALHNSDKPLKVDVLLNWGSSKLPARIKADKILNKPECVALAANKIKSFTAMDGKAPIPPYTLDRKVAEKWIEDGSTVVCRTKVAAKGGEGIVIAEKAEELVDAPLYTVYINKQQEYRIHVMNGKMIHKQRKARSREVPDEKVNWKIRNHENGFIFQINDFELPAVCEDAAIQAVAALGLDFGAVDVIYTARNNKAYVLEVNTAPGMTGTTPTKYKEAIL